MVERPVEEQLPGAGPVGVVADVAEVGVVERGGRGRQVEHRRRPGGTGTGTDADADRGSSSWVVVVVRVRPRRVGDDGGER